MHDDAFDPYRWTAPRKHHLRSVPCLRWMGGLKIISYCVKASVGVYYVGGELAAVIYMIKWFGMDLDLEPSFVVEAISIKSLRTYISKADEIATLELKLGYEFSTKGML
ncbi:hypothetical protein TIFTF001_016348 [Ficus carica]|uniref:Uncharacterized protein n=1 Tax=Ficus carica TaxID=3494 RepID=A0AA88A7K8_FICCA|nr:hypothetical protein TIFTF001_016348 [Ficus carica]